MFDVHCEGHGGPTIVSTRSIVSVDHHDGAITLHLRCWCGQLIEYRTGKGASDQEPEVPRLSIVGAAPPARPSRAEAHFAARLSYETDPSDVWNDLVRGTGRFVLLDARSREAFAYAHLPGAVSGPHAELTPEWARQVLVDHDADLFVTYCWRASCNAATKAAARLASFGLPVKEMLGGIEGWRAEDLPVESGTDRGDGEPGADERLMAS